jgi:diguanylate cyclase (GGDEF)-like protein/PAS domain S-box-containing protein
MTQADATVPVTPRASWVRRCLPGLNRSSAAFWLMTVVLGAVVFVAALRDVLSLSVQDQWFVWAGVLLAAIAGFFPLRLPGMAFVFITGETFVLSLLLMGGPSAAVIATAASALVGSLRMSKRRTNHPFNFAVDASAMAAVGPVFWTWQGHADFSSTVGVIGVSVALVITAVACAAISNLWAATFVSLRESSLAAFGRTRSAIKWVFLTVTASAIGATLLCALYAATQSLWSLAAGPTVLMLLSSIYYHSKLVINTRAADAAQQVATRRTADVLDLHAQNLARSEQRFQNAFTHASIGMALISIDGDILQSNRAFDALLGYDVAHGARRNLSRHVDFARWPSMAESLRKAAAQSIADMAMELRLTHCDGRELEVSLHYGVFSEREAPQPRLILQLQDITARKHMESKLHRVAYFDSLTGLPNREQFKTLLDAAVGRANPSSTANAKPEPFTVMFMDCDRFKAINDSLGHAAGDQFLSALAVRLREAVRPGDVVARLGGDEFAVLLKNLGHHDSVAPEDGDAAAAVVRTIAERMLAAAREPFVVGQTVVNSSLSIGITDSHHHYRHGDAVMRDADIALYAAKGQGKNCYFLFDAQQQAASAARAQLEVDLRHAVAEGQLTVAYQPLIDLRDDRLLGFEALARWVHPTLGNVSPGEFVPMAESLGLIASITDHVLHQATMRLAQWQRLGPTFARLQMHVNIASDDLMRGDLVPRVQAALQRARLDAKHLVLELTETILLDRIDGGRLQLKQLRTMGVGLAIDDFGTGYSSLATLANVPATSIKIDAAFVRDLQAGSTQEGIVRSLVVLASSITRNVIAEGIETLSQKQLLLGLGCNYGQGYLMARPMTPEAVLNLLLPDQAAHATKPLGHGDSEFAAYQDSDFVA